MESLIKALVKAKAKFQKFGRDAKGRTGNQEYRYSTLDTILDSVEPALLEHGLVITQQIDDGTLVTSLWHESGESLSSRYALPSSAGTKEMGSAITYARRYSIIALLCICPDEDDDGAAAPQVAQKPQQRRVAYVPTDSSQFRAMWASVKDAGMSDDEFKVLLSSFRCVDSEGKPSSRCIPTDRLDAVMTAIAQYKTATL